MQQALFVGDPAARDVEVGGYEFKYTDVNGVTDWLTHTDAKGWQWSVFCHRKGDWAGWWYAIVVDPKGPCHMLNTCAGEQDGRERRDPLYRPDDRRTARELIRDMLPLIERGEWPKETIVEKGDGDMTTTITSYQELLAHFGAADAYELRQIIHERLGRHRTKLHLLTEGGGEFYTFPGPKPAPADLRLGSLGVSVETRADGKGDQMDQTFLLPLSVEDLNTGLLELEDRDKARAEGEEFEFELRQGRQ